MSELISRKSYKQIKRIANLLRKEIDFNKSKLYENAANLDFGNFQSPKINGVKIAKAISHNFDIATSTNLEAVSVPILSDADATYVMHTGGRPREDALSVGMVYCIISKLSHMSRGEIASRSEKNAARGRSVAAALSKMNM